MDLEPSSTLLTKLFVADDFFLTCNRVSCVYTLEIEKNIWPVTHSRDAKL